MVEFRGGSARVINKVIPLQPHSRVSFRVKGEKVSLVVNKGPVIRVDCSSVKSLIPETQLREGPWSSLVGCRPWEPEVPGSNPGGPIRVIF